MRLCFNLTHLLTSPPPPPHSISLPEAVHFNRSEYSASEKTHERHIGPVVYHVYELTNDGPSDIIAAEVYIVWPTYTYPDGERGDRSIKWGSRLVLAMAVI